MSDEKRESEQVATPEIPVDQAEQDPSAIYSIARFHEILHTAGLPEGDEKAEQLIDQLFEISTRNGDNEEAVKVKAEMLSPIFREINGLSILRRVMEAELARDARSEDSDETQGG